MEVVPESSQSMQRIPQIHSKPKEEHPTRTIGRGLWSTCLLCNIYSSTPIRECKLQRAAEPQKGTKITKNRQVLVEGATRLEKDFSPKRTSFDTDFLRHVMCSMPTVHACPGHQVAKTGCKKDRISKMRKQMTSTSLYTIGITIFQFLISMLYSFRLDLTLNLRCGWP